MKLFKKCIYLRFTTFITIRLETIFFFFLENSLILPKTNVTVV